MRSHGVKVRERSERAPSDGVAQRGEESQVVMQVVRVQKHICKHLMRLQQMVHIRPDECTDCKNAAMPAERRVTHRV